MVVSLAGLFACAHAGETALVVGGESIKVELADSPGERSQGLMYRDSLAADAGMLFVYPDAAERRFWMKNTRIPLSIAFMDAAGKVVRIAEMQPLDTTTTPSEKPAMYALEMNTGWFAAHGVAVGQTIAGLPAAAAE